MNPIGIENLRYPGAYVDLTPDKSALILAQTEQAVTFSQLDASSNQLARTFRGFGLENQDHVAICMENRVELPLVVWGAHYAGLYYTLLSTRLTPTEACDIIEDSCARVVVLSNRMAEQWMPALGDGLSEDIVVVRVGDLLDLASKQESGSIPDALEGTDMLYSSGTTGRPKGILRPFTNKPLGSTALIAMFGEMLLGMNQETVYLSPAPMYHAAPLRWVQEVMCLGATSIIMERFDPEETLRFIERYGVTHAQFVPTMFIRMLRLPVEVRRRYDLSSLRAVLHAAAPCPPEVKRAMLEWLGPIVYEYYAGTEGAGMCWCSPTDWLTHPGSVGRAVLGQVHIVGNAGEELSTGEEGMVYFGGGNHFEYHNDPAKTSEVHTDDGWSTMGDIGKLDSDGFLYLTDRASNMIITGGVNVYPQEAENLLSLHPKVADVAVIGIPNSEFGEEVKGIVQLSEGVGPCDEVAEELIAYCRENLADLKCPRSIDFVNELPREPNGKLFKRVLRDEYWKGHEARI